MPVIIDFAMFDTQRARDGVNFAPLPVLSIANGAFVNDLAGQSCFPATMGPGATAVVPGTHLYWSTNGGVIKRCNGETPTNVAGGPARDQNYQLLYDEANDRIYVAYFQGVGTSFRVAWFDFAETWDTSITNTLATATGSGCIRLIPTGAVNAGLLLAGWCNDSRAPGTRCVVQRWDPVGLAWVDELFTTSASNQPKTMIANGATVVLGTIVTLNNAAHPLVYERDAAGAWTDITPASWNIAFQRVAGGAAVYNGDLYVTFYRVTAATRAEIWRRDGGTGLWTMDLDLIAEGTTEDPIALTVIDGTLYCGLEPNQVGYYLAKDTPGGAWTRRAVGGSQQFPGQPGDASFFVETLEGTIDPPSGNCSGEHAAQVRIIGYWDTEAFTEGVGAVWERNNGIWLQIAGLLGTQVWLNPGVADPGGTVFIGGGPYTTAYQVGEIDVVDPFVLLGQPSNGKGFASLLLYNPGTPGSNPLYLSDAYEYVCPAITSINPATDDLDGGALITITGTNFFSNLITPSQLANYARVVNRIFVRTGAGTAANPFRTEEVPYRTITFVDTETLTFTLPPFPGGSDPDAEIILSPAGLAPFNFGVPVGIAPSYKCDRLTADFDYTGVDFAILGSLETLLGLGGTGGDVIVPGGGGGGGGAAAATDVLCPTDVTPGPCDRS